MKNFGKGKSSIVGQIPDDCKFTKAKDFVGHYEKGLLNVRGLLKTHSDMYNKDQYSLYIVREGKVDNMDEPYMLMNVPSWYGEKVEADFKDEGLPAEEYFNTSISDITVQSTKKYNSETICIDVYED